MSSFRIFDIAGAGMSAQSVRLNTVASNLANAESVSGDANAVYKAKHPVFQAVQSDQAGDIGNSVLVVEHNLDVIKSADWIIDLGPEGGDEGGYIISRGTPEEVAKSDKSHTGRYLRQALSS